MSVRLRLRREGAKKKAYFRVVAADQRSPRDGRFIEIIGVYHPREDPSRIEIDSERALYWLRNGAQPTESVESLLRAAGIWEEFKPGDKPQRERPERKEAEKKAARRAVAERAQETDDSAAQSADTAPEETPDATEDDSEDSSDGAPDTQAAAPEDVEDAPEDDSAEPVTETEPEAGAESAADQGTTTDETAPEEPPTAAASGAEEARDDDEDDAEENA